MEYPALTVQLHHLHMSTPTNLLTFQVLLLQNTNNLWEIMEDTTTLYLLILWSYPLANPLLLRQPDPLIAQLPLTFNLPHLHTNNLSTRHTNQPILQPPELPPIPRLPRLLLTNIPPPRLPLILQPPEPQPTLQPLKPQPILQPPELQLILPALLDTNNSLWETMVDTITPYLPILWNYPLVHHPPMLPNKIGPTSRLQLLNMEVSDLPVWVVVNQEDLKITNDLVVI